MMYGIVMLDIRSGFTSDSELPASYVKRPDGGNYIACASVNKQTEVSDNHKKYYACGYMTRCAEKIFSVSLETRFNETWKSWMDNLNEDYEALYQVISGLMHKDEFDLKKYRRLCDKGYLLPDEADKINIVILNTGEKTPEAVMNSLSFDFPYSQDLKDYAKAVDKHLFEFWKKQFPEHMYDTVKYFCRNTLARGNFVPYVIEELLTRGLLSELPEKRKKSVMNVAAINSEAFERLK